MGARFFRKLALLAKIETTYGTDPTPTGAANAIVATNVTFTPLEADEVSRDLLLPYLGNNGVILSGYRARIQFSIEIAGAGAAGTAPAYGPLLRACGLAETTSAGVSVTYSPISASFESATLWANWDGVKHVLLGCRGTVSLDFTPAKVAYLKFDLLGLFGTVTDAALPAVTLTAWKSPVVVNKTNTTLTLAGASRIAESVMIDLGQKVEARMLIGDESIQITDRSATGTVVIQADSVAAYDWIGAAKARTRVVLQLVHGTVAGNIVQIDAPLVEIGKPGQGQTQGIINYSLPLGFIPNAGNDEVTITVK